MRTLLCLASLASACGDIDGLPPREFPSYDLVGVIDYPAMDKLVEWFGSHETAGATDVVIYIDSGGGFAEPAWYALETMDSGRVTIHCVTMQAGSAAFKILQGCDVRIIYAWGTLMAHETGAGLDQTDPYIRELNRLGAIHNTARSLMTPEQYHAKVVNGRTWRPSPPEALRLGLVDRIIGQ